MVSWDSLRISLKFSELNDLKVLVFNIYNAYLTEKCWDNIWNVTGLEFDSDREKVVIIVKEICVLKSSG